MDGFLVIDKPQGLTSQQVVSRVRRALRVAKAGHTGTLDPLATGVLPVAFGEATKIIPFLDEAEKVYQVRARLGIATDTYDAEGSVTQQGSCTGLLLEKVHELLQGFLGEQEQVPPAFSAVKVQGKPAYAYARDGAALALKPRRILIHRIEMESCLLPDLVLNVTCSKGTYIRSLVHDLGLALGCYAHVAELRRLRSGSFSLREAIGLEALLSDPALGSEHVQSIEACLQHLPRVPLQNVEERARVQAGVPLRRIKQVLENNHFLTQPVALAYEESVVALVQDRPQGDFAYLRVLNRGS